MKLPLDFTKETYKKFGAASDADLDEYVPYEVWQLPCYNREVRDRVLFYNLINGDFGDEIQKYLRNILDEDGELIGRTIWTKNDKPTEGLKVFNQPYRILYDKTHNISNPVIKNLKMFDFQQKRKTYLQKQDIKKNRFCGKVYGKNDDDNDDNDDDDDNIVKNKNKSIKKVIMIIKILTILISLLPGFFPKMKNPLILLVKKLQ